MSLFKQMLNFFTKSQSGSEAAISPEIEAIFDRIREILADENAQNNRLPLQVRSEIENGLSCDVLPSVSGPFGRNLANPIPVNGPYGELIYLSNLLTSDGIEILFHRIGSNETKGHKPIDIYEIVSIDGKFWDILFFDFYHPRKSNLVPGNYTKRKGDLGETTFFGCNSYVLNFPGELVDGIDAMSMKLFSVPVRQTNLRSRIESVNFVRPPEHVERLQRIQSTIGGLLVRTDSSKSEVIDALPDHMKSVELHKIGGNAEDLQSSVKNESTNNTSEPSKKRESNFGIVGLIEIQKEIIGNIRALPRDIAREAHAGMFLMVHLKYRHDKNLGEPLVNEEIEVYLKSFENFVDNINDFEYDYLANFYQTFRLVSQNEEYPNSWNHGAMIANVIVLAEMIRRNAPLNSPQKMSGWNESQKLLEWLDSIFFKQQDESQYRWSLYFVRDENEIVYAMHCDSVLRMAGYVMRYFANGKRPLPPWSLHLSFAEKSRAFQLGPEHFNIDGDDCSDALIHQIIDIDPGFVKEAKEPIFEDVINERRLKINSVPSDYASIEIWMKDRVENPNKPKEPYFYSIMKEIFGES